MTNFTEVYKALRAKKIQSHTWLGPIRNYIQKSDKVRNYYFESAKAAIPDDVLDGFITWGPDAMILSREIKDGLEEHDKSISNVIGLISEKDEDLHYKNNNYRKFPSTSGGLVDLPDGVETAASILYRCKDKIPAVVFNKINEKCFLYARVVHGQAPEDLVPLRELRKSNGRDPFYSLFSDADCDLKGINEAFEAAPLAPYQTAGSESAASPARATNVAPGPNDALSPSPNNVQWTQQLLQLFAMQMTATQHPLSFPITSPAVQAAPTRTTPKRKHATGTAKGATDAKKGRRPGAPNWGFDECLCMVESYEVHQPEDESDKAWEPVKSDLNAKGFTIRSTKAYVDQLSKMQEGELQARVTRNKLEVEIQSLCNKAQNAVEKNLQMHHPGVICSETDQSNENGGQQKKQKKTRAPKVNFEKAILNQILRLDGGGGNSEINVKIDRANEKINNLATDQSNTAKKLSEVEQKCDNIEQHLSTIEQGQNEIMKLLTTRSAPAQGSSSSSIAQGSSSSSDAV